jgi:hypothetical protein
MSTPRCSVHGTVRNAQGRCFLCDHPDVKWKQDVAREVAEKAQERARVGDVISFEEVRRILDQWAPISVDEAEREMDALD